MSITPPVRTGGQDNFERGVHRASGVLGNVVGGGIYIFTLALMALDIVLNPIFLFAQAKSNGVIVGSPFVSLSWWTIILVTVATTGIQYALLQKGSDKSSIGYKIGWLMAIADTLMDGGGFAAWLNGGDVFKLSGDSHNLFLGIFPPPGKPAAAWVGEIAIMAVCAFHEPFLGQVLGRLHFSPAPDASPGSINISRWTESAGKFHNRVKLVAISSAPYIMMGLDVILFPQSQKGQNGVIQFTWLMLTFIVTLGGMVVWEYWNHLHENNFRLKTLDRRHKMIFLGAIAISAFDSVFDLQGFNQVLFNQSSFIPKGLPPGAIEQYFLTVGVVLLMTTAFEPLNSHLFAPLARLAASLPGAGGMGGGFDPFGGPAMYGPPTYGPPMGGPGGSPYPPMGPPMGGGFPPPPMGPGTGSGADDFII